MPKAPGIIAALSLGLAAAVSSLAGDSAPLRIFPSEKPLKIGFRPSDNGSDVKAFTCSSNESSISVELNDKDKKDKYLFVDFGHLDISSGWPGGYFELDMEADRPLMRVTIALADPANFWSTRVSLEGECIVKPGPYKYRFYLDNLLESRLKSAGDHLYVFIHDSGKGEQGQAKLTIKGLSLKPQSPNWAAEKGAFYFEQYAQKELRELGPLYRGEYSRLVAWEPLRSNPSAKETSLDGAWRKRYAGDWTWNYAALKDDSWAAPDFNDASWETVKIPEEAVEGQKGGHYLYRRKFNFETKPGAKVYLRFDDISNYADIYVNGKKASSQTSVRRRHDWNVEGGSRAGGNAGKSLKEMLAWRIFDRCGIPCPFDLSAIPEGESSLMTPIYTGEYQWPMASDISDLLINGENTIALRLYGCPVKGFWIFKEGSDRAFKSVFGVLGDATLLIDSRPAIASFESEPAGEVDTNGVVARSFKCQIAPSAAKELASMKISLDGDGAVPMSQSSDGSWSAILSMKASFSSHLAKVSALDSSGRVIGERELRFSGMAWELRGKKLFVNGDPYLVRGMNAALGIEWDNDRKVTRREWLRQLRLYQQLGFNTLRLEGCAPQHAQDALEAGMMVMPVYVPGSCDTTMMAFGNLKNPDYEFITDPHKEMAITLSSSPAVLMWNNGNENHHTPGWNDRQVEDKFLETAQAAIRRFDPLKRPSVYANLDMLNTTWFFTKGQEIVGMNTYSSCPQFAEELEQMDKAWSKPVVFTEWGFTENETKGTKYRNDNPAAWEKGMHEKWGLIKSSKASVGGFLYAHHGETKDDKGRELLQKLMSPFSISKKDGALIIENTDVCPFRKLSALLLYDSNLPAAEYAGELAPGGKIALKIPAGLKAPGLRVELRYETHRGLKHFYSRMLDSIDK